MDPAGRVPAVREVHGWDDEALADLARASVDSSFAPDPVRARLRAAVDAWLAGPA
jgi:adenosine deaminase